MSSNSYERKKKQTCEPLRQTLVQATQILPLDYCNSRLMSLFSTQQPEGTFSKTGQIASLLCLNSRSGSHLSGSPLPSHLRPLSPCSQLTNHSSLLALGLTGESLAGLPHGVLPAFRSLFNYCLTKEAFSNSLYFNKIAIPPPWSFSSFFLCFISYAALIVICFPVYLFIVSFLPPEYECREDKGFVCSLLPPRTGPYDLSPFVQ